MGVCGRFRQRQLAVTNRVDRFGETTIVLSSARTEVFGGRKDYAPLFQGPDPKSTYMEAALTVFSPEDTQR